MTALLPKLGARWRSSQSGTENGATRDEAYPVGLLAGEAAGEAAGERGAEREVGGEMR